MKKLEKLLVITEGFPNPTNPHRYTFVEQLINEFAREMDVTVVNPVYHNYKGYQYREQWSYEVPSGHPVTVFQPIIINFSARRIGLLDLMRLSYRSFRISVEKVIEKNHLCPDAVYSHFVLPSGCAAVEIGKKMGVPSFCATGESNLAEIIELRGKKYLKSKLSDISRMISVSSANKKVLAESGILNQEKIIVIPNCVNQTLFFPHDKQKMREKYELSDKDCIGIFVGAYSDRKGIERVNAASDISSVPMIYIGAGELEPKGKYVAFSGAVKHELIPEYLSAADFFVLPTKDEGCCNAIIEAICCGLPIISSNRSFNDDILDEKYAIRIDPEDISQIAKAMKRLASDKTLQNNMSNSAMQQRERFNLTYRADTIMKIMEQFV